MNNFEEEVQYFINLVCKNIQNVKTNKPTNMSKKEMIFFNLNIRLDGQEIIVYDQERDLVYPISVKKIQNYEFKNMDKDFLLNTIDLLTKYINNEISFKNFWNIICQENQI